MSTAGSSRQPSQRRRVRHVGLALRKEMHPKEDLRRFAIRMVPIGTSPNLKNQRILMKASAKKIAPPTARASQPGTKAAWRAPIRVAPKSGAPGLVELLRQPGQQNHAWRRFVDLYTPMLGFWARQLGLRDHDAEDLLQEVFTSVYQKLPTFHRQDEGSFRRWLLCADAAQGHRSAPPIPMKEAL